MSDAVEEVKLGLLDRLRKSKEKAYDPWLERHSPRPYQFDAIKPLDSTALINIEGLSHVSQ